MKRALIIALAALSLCPLVAQPPPTISTSFYAFDYVPGRDVIHIHGAGQAGNPIQLSKANIVGPVKVTLQDGLLPIYDKPVTVEGKVTHPLLGTARFPANLTRALVVLFPGPKTDKEPYRCLVLNHDLSDFPLGVYRMINISPHPIRGAIGKNIMQAKPGGIANLKPDGQPGDIVPVRFEFFDEERWNLLTETRSAIRDDRRWLTCIYKDPVSGRMNIRSIPDRGAVPIPAPTPDAPPPQAPATP